jgi:hypothetical protein
MNCQAHVFEAAIQMFIGDKIDSMVEGIEFSEWLRNKYLEWEKGNTKIRGVSAFADYLQIPQPLVSSWMNGKYKPGQSYAEKLAVVYGDEVFDVLGHLRSDPHMARMMRGLKNLSPEQQDAVWAEIFKILEAAGAKKEFDSSDPHGS